MILLNFSFIKCFRSVNINLMIDYQIGIPQCISKIFDQMINVLTNQNSNYIIFVYFYFFFLQVQFKNFFILLLVCTLTSLIFNQATFSLFLFSKLYSMMLIKQSRGKFVFSLTKLLYSSINYDSKKDYFKVLGLKKTASQAQIKAAYYKLALKYHPDHNKGTQTKFKEINQAYTVLSDPQIKKQYQSSQTYSNESFSQKYQYPFHEQRKYKQNQHEQYWERRNYRFRGRFTQEQFQRYQRRRAQFQQAQRQSSRRWYQQGNQTQTDEDNDNIPKQKRRLISHLKGSFITGVVISLVFLIPQALISKSLQRNQQSPQYGYKNTENGRYPFQKANLTDGFYNNPQRY